MIGWQPAGRGSAQALRGTSSNGCRHSAAAAAAATARRRNGTPAPFSRARQHANPAPCFTGMRAGGQPQARPLPPLRTAGAAGGAAAAAADAAVDPSAAVDHGGRAARLAAPVVIIGGGPAGLCTAVMLARRGYTNVKVYERLPEPPAPDDLSVWGDFEQASERLYMIGLNGRGQGVLRDLGLMETIDSASSLVLGRLDWRPDTPHDSPALTRYTSRTYKTRCIQRDRLASCILRELRARYGGAVSVEFGVGCEAAEWARAVCRVTLRRQPAPGNTTAAAAAGAAADEWTVESGLVLGADGAGSALRDAAEAAGGPLRVRRYEDKNVIVYRTIPLFWPQSMAEVRPGDLNYSARTKSGINLDCLPTKEGPFIGVMLYKPGDKQIAALKTAADVRTLFESQFPSFLPALREVDLGRFAQKADSSLPSFSYAGPVLHHGGSMALLGDAIHTVKPYFGQGVNSAFEDVSVLERALDASADDPAAAVARYSALRSRDAEALVTLSRSLDGGFLTFIGPLILDSMLNKLLPAVFSPNIIASLQNEKWSFSQIRMRKRVDRALQAALAAALLAAALKAASALAAAAARLLARLAAGA
ncbi:MAG: 2-polyprenyl-6-methoxyphenol hydroxylase and related FAD-dependent oxidoreductase [Monoraphidium minutum]|nr:MAG: 2-polyprenyl-6-methoxyphenol hydroxylase and related FAD-dependent oxidoreductase [Monoraphidium minutum]